MLLVLVLTTAMEHTTFIHLDAESGPVSARAPEHQHRRVIAQDA